MAGIDVKGALGRKIGPLPAWSYVVIIAGIAWVVYYFQKRKAATNANATAGTPLASYPTDSAASSDQAFPGDGSAGGISNPVGAGGSTGGTTVTGTTSPQSNADWFRLASNWLVAQGYDAATVNQALNNFLLGQQASAQDRALYNLAVGRFGTPPEGVPLQPTPPSSNPPGLPPGSGGDGGGTQPPTGNPGGSTPPPVPAEVKSRTTVVDGKSLTELLSFFSTSQADFERLNPGIQTTYRWYQAGKGYAPSNVQRPGDIIALNVGTPRVVWVMGNKGW